MNNEYSATASIEDLLAEDDVEVLSGQPTSIRTGVGGATIADPQQQRGFDPNATRYLFNPFEVIDLQNEGSSCGMPFLANVVFNRVKSIRTAVAKTDAYNLPTMPGDNSGSHNPNNYEASQRTAWMIALELTNKHGDKGVIDIADLTGQPEDVVARVNEFLFGSEISCVVDVNNPDHPVPVLPVLLETLDRNVRQHLNDVDVESRALVTSVARQVRDSIQLAIRNARTRIGIAQDRLLDTKNPNRTFSHAEERCYLALGQEIPNQLPYLTESASQTMGGRNTLDVAAIAQAVAAGVSAAQAPRPLDMATASVSMKTGMQDNVRPDFVAEPMLDSVDGPDVLDDLLGDGAIIEEQETGTNGRKTATKTRGK